MSTLYSGVRTFDLCILLLYVDHTCCFLLNVKVQLSLEIKFEKFIVKVLILEHFIITCFSKLLQHDVVDHTSCCKGDRWIVEAFIVEHLL